MKTFAKSLFGIAIAGMSGAAALGLASGAALAAEKWDMPLAYPASNYHSENATAFAEAVTKASGGELEIVPHPGGSPFGGGEIYPAVRPGQDPIGERLIPAPGNEDPPVHTDAPTR